VSADLDGAEMFVDIARLGQKKLGTPIPAELHDHLGDIFATLDATEFQCCLGLRR
jgi:hypothetical protein